LWKQLATRGLDGPSAPSFPAFGKLLEIGRPTEDLPNFSWSAASSVFFRVGSYAPGKMIDEFLPGSSLGNPHGQPAVNYESFARDVVVGDELND
jgi:hypothetical protein